MEDNSWEEIYEIMGVSSSDEFRPMPKNYNTSLMNWA